MHENGVLSNVPVHCAKDEQIVNKKSYCRRHLKTEYSIDSNRMYTKSQTLAEPMYEKPKPHRINSGIEIYVHSQTQVKQ